MVSKFRRNAPQPAPEMPMMGAGAAPTPGGAPPGNARTDCGRSASLRAGIFDLELPIDAALLGVVFGGP
jgi:hypothetical protein